MSEFAGVVDAEGRGDVALIGFGGSGRGNEAPESILQHGIVNGDAGFLGLAVVDDVADGLGGKEAVVHFAERISVHDEMDSGGAFGALKILEGDLLTVIAGELGGRGDAEHSGGLGAPENKGDDDYDKQKPQEPSLGFAEQV